ncbi:MAG: hypothetical protein Q8R70_03820 [Methanoregula sp.]|nr:hypothetical protein [Methanoregula sp.]
MKKRWLLTICLLLMGCVLLTGCLDYLTETCPRHWTNETVSSSPNTTLNLRVDTLGPARITVLDSDSDVIGIAVNYCADPAVKYRETRERLYINAFVTSPHDATKNVVADILVSLPGNTNYTMNIWNQQYTPVTNQYTGGNLTLWTNHGEHLPPTQIDDLGLTRP